MKSELDAVIGLCEQAGQAILAVYNQAEGFDVDTKADDSPLTQADLASHKVLVSGLRKVLDIPILSEESKLPDFETRQSWSRYWLIDPLDGTKEFVKRNGEFTVNVALIDNHRPILGVVYVPVLNITYAGYQGAGALKVSNGHRERISVRKTGSTIDVVASRSHGADAVNQLMDKLDGAFDAVNTTNMGSSLKLCLVAEGKADLYPRLALTAEWDTAAAQAIVEAAGGQVVDLDFQTMEYNRKDDILNPFFYVIGDSNIQWKQLLC